MTFTRSQIREYDEAGKFPPDDYVMETLHALYEALEQTSSALQAVLSSNPVRNADEIIVHNNKLLS